MPHYEECPGRHSLFFCLARLYQGEDLGSSCSLDEEDLQLAALLTSDPRWEFETQLSEIQPSAPVDCLSTHLGPDDDEHEEDDDFLDPAQAAIFLDLQSAIAQILRDGGLGSRCGVP